MFVVLYITFLFLFNFLGALNLTSEARDQCCMPADCSTQAKESKKHSLDRHLTVEMITTEEHN